MAGANAAQVVAELDGAPLAQPASVRIEREELERHVRWLAADELEGRRTGSPGARRAAEYLARELAAAGLEPAGGERSFLSAVPLTEVRASAAPRLEFLTAAGERVLARAGADYLWLDGAPGELELDLAHWPSWEDAPAPAGAARALLLGAGMRAGDERLRAHACELVLLAGAASEGRERDARVPAPRLVRGSATQPARVQLRGPLLARARAGEFARVALSAPGESAALGAWNVLARLPGSHPSGEFVVLSAHYDHLGLDAQAAAGADRIFNGADDDASGCALVLELAEAIAAGPRRARGLLVLLATGEEQGLLGTEHYIEHPVVSLARTRANLNLEMVGRPDARAGAPGSLWLTGFERSNLGAACASGGLAITPDPYPEQRFFERSDNYAFARRGVVAQTLSSYALHEDYHRTTDEAERLDFDHMRRAAEHALGALELLLDGDFDARWEPGANPSRARSASR
jgi:aminopeptidase YwaD